jgi:hypothetical protein
LPCPASTQNAGWTIGISVEIIAHSESDAKARVGPVAPCIAVLKGTFAEIPNLVHWSNSDTLVLNSTVFYPVLPDETYLSIAFSQAFKL